MVFDYQTLLLSLLFASHNDHVAIFGNSLCSSAAPNFQFFAVWIFPSLASIFQSCSLLYKPKEERTNPTEKGPNQTMNVAAQENQADAAGGAVMAVAAAEGGGDEAGNVAAAGANQEGNGGSNIEASSENSNNQIGEEAMDVDNAANGATAAPSSRYSLRKRKSLLAVQGSNSTSAAGAGNSNSNSNSAVTAADALGYVNTAALTDRQFEKMLAKYEEDGVRERAQKKLRLERGYGDDDYPYEAPPEGCPPFSSLPKEAIQLVFELRSVFNLSFQSKYMLSFVEERVSGAGDR